MNFSRPAVAQKSSARLKGLNRIARRILFRRLNGIREGEIVFRDAEGEFYLGNESELRAEIQVNDSRFFRDALLGGPLSVAESYLRGDWDSENLCNLFRVFIRNTKATDRMRGGIARLSEMFHRIYHLWHANSPQGSRRNIGAHYDLGNDFFELWLDESMTYSSGIFPTTTSSMHEASIEKNDRICQNLDLCQDDHLLEIGSGWGALAIHAARNYGCKVTTTTISTEQFRVVRQRIDDAGLSHRITLLAKDYRELTGQFNKLVSVEMIEAVGHRYLDTYFRKCSDLLSPEGTMVLQAIVAPERGYAQYLQGVDFIQRYIFPGGCLPSLATVLESVGRSTNLRFVHAEDFASHYVKTLQCWRREFIDHQSDVRRLGYSNQFIRMWVYYLCYCEAVFEERHAGVLHIQFDKPARHRDPMSLSRWSTSVSDQSQPARFLQREQALCSQEVEL